MQKKEYEFIGKNTQFMTIANLKGTVQEIYDYLIEKEILDWDTVEDWVFENKLDEKNNEIRQAYLDCTLDDNYPIDEFFNKVSRATIGLNDDEMMDIISYQSSNMYYQEWYELDEKGNRIEDKEELEKLIDESIEYFNDNNWNDIYINSKIETTYKPYCEGYDLKLELEALDYEQVEQIAAFIKKLADENL